MSTRKRVVAMLRDTARDNDRRTFDRLCRELTVNRTTADRAWAAGQADRQQSDLPLGLARSPRQPDLPL